MFTSLMIILLAFFILLSSIAVIDEKRQLEAIGSLVGAFGLLPGGLSPSQTAGRRLAPPTSPIEAVYNDLEHIRSILSQQIMQSKIHYLRGRTRRIISLEAPLLFSSGQVQIREDMKPILLQISQVLKDSDYPIIIEGHTDDQPPRTDEFRDNWQISILRAVNILRFFIEQGGLKPERLAAYGYAGNKPAVANNSPRNRARNNRVDLILDHSYQGKVNSEEQDRLDKVFDFKGFYFRLYGDHKNR